jgi:hypothetical protein
MLGFVLQANRTATQIRNVIVVIKGSEEPDRYSAALLLIKTPTLGNILSFCRMSIGWLLIG